MNIALELTFLCYDFFKTIFVKVKLQIQIHTHSINQKQTPHQTIGMACKCIQMALYTQKHF